MTFTGWPRQRRKQPPSPARRIAAAAIVGGWDEVRREDVGNAVALVFVRLSDRDPKPLTVHVRGSAYVCHEYDGAWSGDVADLMGRLRGTS